MNRRFREKKGWVKKRKEVDQHDDWLMSEQMLVEAFGSDEWWDARYSEAIEQQDGGYEAGDAMSQDQALLQEYGMYDLED